MSDLVSLKELARRLQVNPTTVRRLLERFAGQLGITIEKGRGNTSNAKWTHYVSRDDADRLVAFYESRHGVAADTEGEEAPLASRAFGSFYVIQLVPEALPNRLKIGYTDNLEKRLAEHQTAAPTARVLASWPCKRSWDHAAMDSITREQCSWVLNEVFEGDPDGFLLRGNAFFALMPGPDVDRPLSDHSPLHRTA